MRQFGNDAPEFMAFTLGGGDEVYRLPLATSLPFAKLIALRDAVEKGETEAMRFQLGLLREYMGEVVDGLTASQVGEIFAAWNAESERQGASVGE